MSSNRYDIQRLNILKKIIAIAIAVILPINASAVKMFNNINEVKTNAGTWASPSTKMKYHFGGSYEFTFKGGNKYQPWATWSNPSVDIGCNGVSLKAGFIGLLGLNEIKDQLEKSGQALAWGVLIGLQYAMPSLFQVFKTIREWATTIQRLLQNACQIGTMIAARGLKSMDAKGKIDSFISSTGISDALTKPLAGTEETRQSIEKFVDCSTYETNSLAQETCLSKLGNVATNADKKILSSSGANSKGSAGIISVKIASFPSVPINKIIVKPISSFFEDGKLSDDIKIIDNELEELKRLYLLKSVFFGDLMISSKTFKEITKLTGFNGGSGSYEIDSDKLKAQLEDAYLGMGVEDLQIKYTLAQPIISSPEIAAKALIYGIQESNNKESCGDGYCNVPDNLLFYYDFRNKVNGTSGTTASYSGYRIKPILGITNIALNDTSTDNADNLKLEWKGSKEESLKAILERVKEKTQFQTQSTEENLSTGETSFDYSTINAPLLVPNVEKFIGLIAKIERIKGETTPFSSHLKTVLAEYNAFLISKGILDLMYGEIINAMSGENIADVTELEAANKRLLTMRTAILEELNSLDISKIDYIELNELFDIQEKALQTQSVGNL